MECQPEANFIWTLSGTGAGAGAALAIRLSGQDGKIRALYREHYPTGSPSQVAAWVEVAGFVWVFIVAVILLHSN